MSHSPKLNSPLSPWYDNNGQPAGARVFPELCSFCTKRLTATNGDLFRDSQAGQQPILN
ncbi:MULTISPECIES: hypothetical protein [Moorena]|uniref:hypothetical protein n=1 Tax=Moorena TaxID=1155738 RepID=UPI0002D33E0F|nr:MULTISPECIES: hypothetical protein [Moorena]NEQ15838.1 hypothetical protein [Moorena sp. SIO3E2]NEP31327.1 hypothetical protein [Moorena sp. SIO3B2]NEQ05271.1 hypothetical protein [Moorena sp. SIO4E2]NER87407.1 hypothetical protein [Moorena sp. SIO3A2]NES43352.1 hypothetical protein [Moorena sp. SIO2C4]